MPEPLSVGVELIGDGLDDRVFDGARPWRGVAAVAAQLESAGVGYWVIGADRGEPADPERVSLDPSLVATVAARHSTSLGLVVAAAAHRDHPYNLARRLVSVDHAARGRVGWLALEFDHGIGLNAATDTWTDAELDTRHTTNAVAAVRTLWRTWPLDSVIGDRTTGIFSDTSQIRRADVTGGYAITGPLNVPGSVQGDLPIWRNAGRGDEHAGGGADLVVIEDTVEEAEHGAPVPRAVPVVVRLRSPATFGTALARLAATDGVVGVVLRLDPTALPLVLEETLADARRRGLVAAPAGAGTLRDRLRLPVPTEPDLSAHALAFSAVPNPGGRL